MAISTVVLKHPVSSDTCQRAYAEEAKQNNKRPLWLFWVGRGIPQLHEIWRQYLRVYIDDRFAKHRFTGPAGTSTPEQSERWSELTAALPATS